MCFATAKGERFISGKLRRDEMRKNYCYYIHDLWLLYTEQSDTLLKNHRYRLGLEGLEQWQFHLRGYAICMSLIPHRTVHSVAAVAQYISVPVAVHITQ